MTPEMALALFTVIEKIYLDIRTGDPIDVSSEIAALEAARMRPSQDVIDEADKASQTAERQ